MIIQVRGTSGSGKTTALRKFLGPDLAEWEPRQCIDGRRKPAYYVRNGVAVLGHYESVCGGCDTFKGYGQLQTAVRTAYAQTGIVVMEGLMVSDDVLQTVKIAEEVALVRVLFLVTPLEVCIARVKQRRTARGQDTVFNEEKLRNRAAQIERTRPRLEAAGITCRSCTDNQCPATIYRWINEEVNNRG